MRGTCPVAHSEYLGWSVFSHHDVVAIAEDESEYSSRVSATHPAMPNGFDPPQHGPYRRVIDRYFRPDEVAEFEGTFSGIARELVDEFPRDGEVEFIDRFALTFALRAERAWLGWPDYTEDALRTWMISNHRATLSGDREELNQVARDFDDTVRRVIAQRRAHTPRHRAGGNEIVDVTGRLLSDSVDGEPLTDDEIVAILRNWTVGELGTMAASVGILIEYLARRPELQERLRNTPEELPLAIDEILRIHAPLTSNRRVTTRAVELGGRTIDAGERVTIFWGSANRDEAVFGDPDEFRPHANALNNVLYGRGIHFCPGAPLARLELRVALATLLAATHEIRLAPGVPPDYAIYPASGFQTLALLITRPSNAAGTSVGLRDDPPAQ